MAAATVVSGYPIKESLGSLSLHIVKFSSLADTNTYASGLGTSVVGYWASAETNESTAGDEGISVANSSGTFTCYLKTTATVAFLYILSRS